MQHSDDPSYDIEIVVGYLEPDVEGVDEFCADLFAGTGGDVGEGFEQDLRGCVRSRDIGLILLDSTCS